MDEGEVSLRMERLTFNRFVEFHGTDVDWLLFNEC